MKKQYTVFSVHRQPAQAEVTLADGVTKVLASVDSIEIQLVPADGVSGTLKLVYTNPDEIATAEELLAGTVISVDFNVEV